MLANYNQETTVADYIPADFNAYAENEPPSGLHYHFVFCANVQIDALSFHKREKFYRFIANCVRVQQGNVEAVGGKNESVHLLVSLNLVQNPADFVKRVKLLSASWAKRNLNMSDFAWQEEEVFTVSDSQRNHISRRIQHQSQTGFRSKAVSQH